MRSSEELAYAIYLADCKHDLIGTSGSSVQPYTWDELHEEHQQEYMRHGEAVLKYLFEHGRISSYINAKQLAAFSDEYTAYLQTKNG